MYYITLELLGLILISADLLSFSNVKALPLCFYLGLHHDVYMHVDVRKEFC